MLEPQRDINANIDSRSILANKKSTESNLFYFLKYNKLPLKSSKLSRTRPKTTGRSNGFFAQERDSMLEYLAKTAVHPYNFKTLDSRAEQRNELDYIDIGIEHIFSEIAVLLLNRRTAVCTTIATPNGVMLLSKLIPNLTSFYSLKKSTKNINHNELHLADVIATTLLLMNFDIHDNNVSEIDGILGFIDHGKAGYFKDPCMQSLANLLPYLRSKLNLNLRISDDLLDLKLESGKNFFQNLLVSILNKTNISQDFIEILINRRISDLISLGYDLKYLHRCFFENNKLARKLFKNLDLEDKKSHLVDFITETLHTHFKLLRTFALSLCVPDLNGSISVPEIREKLRIELPQYLSIEQIAKNFESRKEIASIRSQSPYCSTYNISRDLVFKSSENLSLLFDNLESAPAELSVDFKLIPDFLSSTSFKAFIGRDFNPEERITLTSFAKKMIAKICEMKCEEKKMQKAILKKKVTQENLVDKLTNSILRRSAATNIMLEQVLNLENPANFIRDTVHELVIIK